MTTMWRATTITSSNRMMTTNTTMHTNIRLIFWFFSARTNWLTPSSTFKLTCVYDIGDRDRKDEIRESAAFCKHKSTLHSFLSMSSNSILRSK